MIEVQHVFKQFNAIPVLKDISTTMKTGDINTIIGTSGGGKTVFMKILLGLFAPDSGRILYDGISFVDADKTQKRVLMSKIGMVFQGSALFDSLNVAENVMMPLDFYTNDKYQVKLQKVKKALDKVNLSHALTKYSNEISGGMKRRVAIARAMIMEPTYLFCDEPNSGLDPQTSVLIDKLIYGLTKDHNMTTIINTHDMNTVLTMGGNVNFLSQGVLVWKGHHQEIEHSNNQQLKEFVFAGRFISKDL